MQSATSSVASVAAAAGAAATRFPGALGSALVGGALFIRLAGQSELRWPTAAVAGLTVTLGVPLFLAIDLAFERVSRGRPAAARALASLAGAAALLALFWLTRDATTFDYPVRYLQLSLGVHLLVAFVAFVGRGEDNGFWQFNRLLFLRFLESALYAAVLFGGLAAGVLAVTRLFDVRAEFLVYARLWILVVFVPMTWRFLSAVPAPLGALEADDRYPRGVRLFVQYLLVPLALLYGVILYAYLAKIVVLWTLPKGEVGWLVSAAAVFGTFTLLLLHPVSREDGPRWARLYARLFGPAMIPLLGMLFVALARRIGEYGVTERRYFLGALAAWLLAVALYVAISRRPRVIAVPLTLAAITFVTAVGPWGAYAVSARSQQARLEALLSRDGLWRDGRLEAAAREVSWHDRREISRILDYLADFHGRAALSRWFAGALAATDDGPPGGTRERVPSLMATIGLRYVAWHESADRIQFYSTDNREAVDVAGYDYMIDLQLGPTPTPFTLGGHAYSARLDGPTASLELRRGPDLLTRQSLAPLLTRLPPGGASASPPRAARTFAWESEHIGVKVVIRSLSASRSPDGRVEVRHGAAVLLLRPR